MTLDSVFDVGLPHCTAPTEPGMYLARRWEGTRDSWVWEVVQVYVKDDGNFSYFSYIGGDGGWFGSIYNKEEEFHFYGPLPEPEKTLANGI